MRECTSKKRDGRSPASPSPSLRPAAQSASQTHTVRRANRPLLHSLSQIQLDQPQIAQPSVHLARVAPHSYVHTNPPSPTLTLTRTRARAPRRRRAASSGVCPRRRSRNPGERYVTRRYEPGSAAGPSSPAVSRRAGVPGSAFALAADERSDRTPLAPPALPTLSGPETAWCGAETVRTPFPLSARLSPRAHPAGTPSNCVHPSAGAGEHLSARRALLRLSNRPHWHAYFIPV